MSTKHDIHIPIEVAACIGAPGETSLPYSLWCPPRIISKMNDTTGIVTVNKIKYVVHLVAEQVWVVDNGIPFQMPNRLITGDKNYYRFINGQLSLYFPSLDLDHWGMLRQLEDIDRKLDGRQKLSPDEKLPLLLEGRELTIKLELERATVRYNRLLERIQRS